MESVKHSRHYLHGQTFHIRTDHAPLRSVLKVKEPETQLARWIEFLSTFEYEIEYREGQRHTNADAMSRRPSSEGCRWCKEWKKAEQLISVVVQTEISISKTEEFAEEEADSTQVERNKWKSMIEYCVGDGRKEMVSGRRTRLYCNGICKRLHLRHIITTQMPAIGG